MDILKYTNKNILVVGDVMLDSYYFGSVERLSPEAPVPICDIINKTNKLGGSANVALNIKKLNNNPILISVIGYNDKSDIFLNLLKENDIDTSFIIKSKNRITTNKIRVIGNDHHLIRIDEESKNDLNNKDLNCIIKNINKVIKNIDTILIQDYDKGVINKKLIRYLINISKQYNIPIICDPKIKNFKFYKGIELIKPNFSEFKKGMKIEISLNEIELSKYCKKLHKEQNIKTIMITLSKYGIYISKNDNGYHQEWVRTNEIEVSDVSGAGDSVIAVLSFLIHSDLSIIDISKICNIAGGMVCKEVGVVPIFIDDLQKEISKEFIY